MLVPSGGARRIKDLPVPLRVSYNKLEDEKRCRLCLRPRNVRPLVEHELAGEDVVRLTRHHLVPKWWAADRIARGLLPDRRIIGCAANFIPLCRPCHDGVEYDPAARRMLRAVMRPEEEEFVVRVAGRAWLDETYPRREARPGV